MELANCKHTEEETLGVSQGLTLVACRTCGQTRRYKRGDDLSIVITKLGRIGDSIVMPLPGQSLGITPEETRLVREGFDIIEEERLSQKNLGKITKAHPPKASKRRLYYDEHQEEILADYGLMAVADLERKWNM